MKHVLTFVLSISMGFFITGIIFACFVKVFGKMPNSDGLKAFNCIGGLLTILLCKPFYIVVKTKLITD